MKKFFGYFAPESRFWTWAFVWALIIGAGLHFMTVSYSPVPWLDEVQIVEIAQGGVGTKNTDWGVCIPANAEYADRAWAVYYLGGLVNEYACQLFSIYGPRSASLLGLVLASGLLFAYVRRRGGERVLAAALSLCFFAAPCITQSVRGARVDIWPLVCLFAALHCLHGLNPDHRKGMYARCFMAGALSTAGCFFWAVGCFLLPLYAWGFFENFERPIRDFRKWIGPAVVAALGVAFAAGILLIPFYSDLTKTIEMAQWISAHNTNSNSAENIREAWSVFLHQAILGFPLLFTLGFACVLAARRNFWMKLGFLAMFVVCVLIAARMYVFRLSYFAAYAFLGVICAMQWKAKHRKIYIGMLVVLVLMALASYGRSVLVRDGVEFLARNGRSHAALRTLMASAIGTDRYVYLCTFEPYYVGRELNWKMFNCPLQGSPDDIKVSWDKIDAVLCTVDNVGLSEDFLKNKGFTKRTELNMPDPHYGSLEKRILDITHRKKVYGPYLLFTRPNES